MSDAGEAIDLDDAITDRPPPVRPDEAPSIYDAPPLPFVRGAPGHTPLDAGRVPEDTPIVRLDPPPRRRSAGPPLRPPEGINPGLVLALGVVTLVVATVWGTMWIG